MTKRLGIAGLLWLTMAACTGSSDGRIELGTPLESQGISDVARLTDGRRAFEGNAWKSTTASIFRSPRAFATYDLGQPTTIAAAYVQGDNNDRFMLEVSDDGIRFEELWVAGSVAAPGLRARTTKSLDRTARYIRLTAQGGDSWVSASELQLFSSVPRVWPPLVLPQVELRSSLFARLALWLFGLFAVLAVLLHRKGERRALVASLSALAAVSAGAVVFWVVELWPPEPDLIDASRAVAAAVAGAVVLRLGFRPQDANATALTALLGAMAALSVLTFYNYGHPQFYDAAKRSPTYVHTWDMRVYFPVAKYFDELGYDGVYLASVKAYAEDELGDDLASVRNVTLRDLRNYEMRQVSDIEPEIHAVKDRFSPERWAELKQDMSYFWETMGRNAYLGSLRDHGGNATPAWMVIAHAIYGSASAKEATFIRAALLDPLLLLIFFVAAWRTFGLRTALVCLVAYGATTIYQFGSNWAGSTLRNDWMVLLGLGVCALASRRPFVAGLLLGWSAMIRAFPALALLFLAAPVAWELFERTRARGTMQKASALDTLMPLLKVAAGTVAVVIVLGTWSTLELGWEKSWGEWSQKIAMHADKPNVNHLGIRALVGYDYDNLWHNLSARGIDPEEWGPRTAQTMKERRWLTVTGMLFFTLLAVIACRGSPLSDAAVIGTMMIPVYFYPSNYYLHILFIWPLLLASRSSPTERQGWSLVAATVLGSCAIQWFGWLVPGRYGQFLFWSGVILATIAALLGITIVVNRSRAKATLAESERPAASLAQQAQQVAE